MLVDELNRCGALGLSQFNFHPGAAMDSNPEKCMEKIAQAINHAHQQTPAVITGQPRRLLENVQCFLVNSAEEGCSFFSLNSAREHEWSGQHHWWAVQRTEKHNRQSE